MPSAAVDAVLGRHGAPATGLLQHELCAIPRAWSTASTASVAFFARAARSFRVPLYFEFAIASAFTFVIRNVYSLPGRTLFGAGRNAVLSFLDSLSRCAGARVVICTRGLWRLRLQRNDNVTTMSHQHHHTIRIGSVIIYKSQLPNALTKGCACRSLTTYGTTLIVVNH